MPNKEKVNLAEVLKQNAPESPQHPEQTQALAPPAPISEKTAPSRHGKKNISGYFAPEVHRQLRIIAAEEDKTLQEVLADALNALFQRKGRPPIA